MEMESRYKRTAGTRLNICLKALCGILLVIIIIIASLTLHKVYQSTSESQPDSKTVFQRFPGYFRTEQEQNKFAVKIPRFTSRKNFTIPASRVSQTCSVQCVANPDYITPGGSFASTSYNGCCISSPGYIAPEYMVDIGGVNRKMAQFPTFKQYFYQETCEQVKGCTGCTCQLRITNVRGVYVLSTDGKKTYGLDWFPMGVCCKCLNQI